MARAIRAKPAPKEPTPEPAPSSTKPLPEATANPPKLFILPKNASADARIITLANPANSTPSRYFFCPSNGFYEFTRISAPKRACRSWLLTSEAEAEAKTEANAQNEETETEPQTGLGSGFVTKDAALFLATPIDLLFLILPVLAPKSPKEKSLFLALDDYIDALTASSPQWGTILSSHPSLRDMLEKRMGAVCDTVDAGEIMYRLSQEKLVQILMRKAERAVAAKLPLSLDDRFVKTALEVPVLSVRREDGTLCGGADEADADNTTARESSQPQPQTETNTESAEAETKTPHDIPPLLRLRTTLTYLTTAYLPSSLAPTISTHPSLTPLFAPLSAHLASLAALKAEALALRSISDNITRKRGVEEDEERALEREEKRRKAVEEKKRESVGVRKLKKVDTSGMRKMSDFFGVKSKKTA